MPEISAASWDEIVLCETPRRNPVSSYFLDDEYESTFFWSPPFADGAGIAFGRVDGGLMSHPATFAGGLAGYATLSVPEGGGSIRDILIAERLLSPGDGLTIRLPPEYYFQGESQLSFWRGMGPHLVPRPSTYVLPVGGGLHFSPRRKRALAKARSLMATRIGLDDGLLEETWSVVERFYRERGLALSVDGRRVRRLLTIDPELFEVAAVIDTLSGEAVGAALIIWAGECGRLPIYVADGRSFPGATEVLVSWAFERAKQQRKNYLDLGTAVDQRTGLVSEGIATFKVECGATPHSIFEAEFRRVTALSGWR